MISIVLPVYNQADHIGQIIDQYLLALEKVPSNFEIILVPNACRDSSAQVCQAIARKNSAARVIETAKGGWGHAVKLGLAEAKGELLCYTNSARTSPEILTLLLLYAVVHPNVVLKANRKIRDNIMRRLGSLLYNLECRAFFDLPVWDINGTPKVFPRAFSALLKLQRDDDLIDAEFNAICRRENYPILEVPVLSTKRHSGKATTNFNSAFKMYLGAYQLWQQIKG